MYVDDSGDDEIGASMSALLLPAERWSQCLGYWTALRARLEADHELPKSFEIHSNAFLTAHPLKDVRQAAERRNTIITARHADSVLDAIVVARAQLELAELAVDRALLSAAEAGKDMEDITATARMNQPDVLSRLNQARSLDELKRLACFADAPGARTRRRKMYEQLLHQINNFPEAQLVTVCANDGDKGTMRKVYAKLLDVVDGLLADQGRWGTVVVDGTPSARTLYYREAHRNLELGSRRILEDEVMRSSGESHFIQMTDMCAHSAFGWRRKGAEDRRYLLLKDIVVTADGEPFGAANPGFHEVR